LQLLLEPVGTASTNWKVLGLALGFHMSELKEIEATVALTTGGPEACFTELLSRWLDWAPPKPFPTWRSLAEALRSETVKEYGLANDLEKEFSENGELGIVYTYRKNIIVYTSWSGMYQCFCWHVFSNSIQQVRRLPGFQTLLLKYCMHLVHVRRRKEGSEQ